MSQRSGSGATSPYSSAHLPTWHTPGQDQLPILCARCMGPAQPGENGVLTCAYCGHRDQLPADQLGRALELKRRLGAAKNSVANVEGMEGALSEIFESRGAFWRASGLYVAAAVLITGYSLWQVQPVIAKAPPGFALGLTLNALMGGMWIGGFALALLAAFAVGRRQYRKHVRTQLFARLPHQPGAPARCRACGGDLPDRREPFVQCAYCSTRSLVTPELASNRQMLLERERAFYAERAGHALGGMRGTSLKMSRTLIICGVATYAAVIGVAYLAAASFPH
jgi:DNA-directed RNA polymerase subunit RPC12/RpoP